MLTGQKHIVKKQVYNISVETPQNSHAIHEKISTLNNSVVLPLADKACSELNADGSNIRIDKLEIDMGDLNFDTIGTQIEEIFYTKFYEKLSHEIAAHIVYENKDGLIVKAPKHTKLEKIEYYLITGLLPWWHSKGEEFDITAELDEVIEKHSDDIKHIFIKNLDNTKFIKRASYLLSSLKFKEWFIKLFPSKARKYSDILDDLMIFAKTNGILTYSWQHSLIAETMLSLSFSEKEISHEAETVELIHNLLLGLCDNNHDKYAEVIESTINTSKYKSVLPIIAKQLKSNLPQITGRKGLVKPESAEGNVKQLEPDSAQEAKTSNHLAKTEILKQDADKELISPEQFNEKTSLVSSQKPESEINEEFNSPVNLKGKASFADNKKPKGETLTPDTNKGVTSLEQLKEKVFAGMKKSSTYEGKHSYLESESITHKDSSEKEFKEAHDQKFKNIETPDDLLQSDIEDIYIDNAGLILLCPFLKKLFVNLKFYNANGWSADNGYDKAIQLLQYMAIGSLKFKEHELPLNKILCGSDIFYPVQPEALLAETEIMESDALLKSVIASWNVLKNTSVEGFRTSFLQREGRLTVGENSWKLYIERKSYDVLLDRLPWAISVIKLEWMPKPIYTEW